MSDFKFLQDQVNKNWVVMAPRRAKRPQEEGGKEPACPFCPGGAGDKEEIDRISVINVSKVGEVSKVSNGDRSTFDTFGTSKPFDTSSSWLVRVLANKYPFAPIHEVIIHSPDHHKNFDTLPVEHVTQILRMYHKRYLLHQNNGQVYIFHNRGEAGGESLPHPHSQLVVVPSEVEMQIPVISSQLSVVGTQSVGFQSFGFETEKQKTEKPVSDNRKTITDNRNPLILNTKYFILTCPEASQWPDEVWIVPQERNKSFGQITDEEISDLAKTLQRLIQLFDLRYKKEFPFNFYIAPGKDWYLRLIPRIKTLGGFELGTGVYVNTQDPKVTIAFIKKHFAQTNLEKVAMEYEAEYERRV